SFRNASAVDQTFTAASSDAVTIRPAGAREEDATRRIQSVWPVVDSAGWSAAPRQTFSSPVERLTTTPPSWVAVTLVASTDSRGSSRAAPADDATGGSAGQLNT